ncbi:MAG: hypothetical protein ACI841_004072, partial [Planctomycetota bacterium]
GYQADVGLGWWGKLYDEHGRGLLDEGGAEDGVIAGDWNRYEILATGSHIQTAINGYRAVDFTDPEERAAGVIAFQMHSGGAMDVRFRIVSLELDPDVELSTVK